MKSLLKKLARVLLGDYAPYYIYASPDTPAQPPVTALRVARIEPDALAASADEFVRQQSGYAGDGAFAYACHDGERVVGLCFYWHGERYRTRNFWPLGQDEAKLVQIITAPDMQGRNIAGALIRYSRKDLAQQGMRRLYARIWHSNQPSIRAFEKAGWRRIAFVIEIFPFGRSKPLRLTRRYEKVTRT